MKRIILLLIMLMAFGADAALAQTKAVMGRVLDDKGYGIPSATVRVKGTEVGTVTDVDGNFKLNVSEGAASLEVNSIGFIARDVPITNGTINVRMVSTSTTLSGTVVTALGISREKKSLGYSTSTVSGDDLRGSGEQNIIEGLAAKAPGIQVTSSAGTPGASSKIVIRGNTSFTGSNSPLIVLDGVPIDNSTNTISAADNAYNQNLQGVAESNRALDINPEDIESVSILKGPAAAALYGARGANGAIIYTTKRGKSRKGIGVEFSTSLEVTKVSRLPKLQNKYAQGDYSVRDSTYVYNTFNPGPDGIAYTADDIAQGTGSSWGPTAATLGLKTYDNVDRFFQTGYSYNNNLSFYGGNETSTFRVNIGNTNMTGVVPNTKLNRTTVRLTGDTKLSSKLDVGGTVNYSNTSGIRAQNGSNLGGVMLTLLRTPITFNMDQYKDATGTQIPYFASYDNPLFSVYESPYYDQTNRVTGNVNLNYAFTKYLKLGVRSGLDYYNTTTKQIYAINSQASDIPGAGQVNLSNSNSKQLYTDAILRWNRPVSENITLNALLGYNYTYEESNQQFSRGRVLGITNFYNLSNASELYSNNSESYLLTQALFGELGADYKGQLFVSLTGRNEWSSGFGRHSKGFFYPKADASWVFSQTFKLPNWFSFGKVRAAYANSGNAPTPYSDRTYYSVPFVADGFTTGLSYPYIGAFGGYGLANVYITPGLKPENVTGKEAGLELYFFKRRISLELSVYKQTTHDALLQKPVAGSSGFQAQYVNAGTMDNKGVEVALGLTPIKSRDFQWNINTNFSRNRSKVTQLANGVSEINIEVGFSGIYSYATVGEPYGVFYGTSWQRDNSGNLLIGADGLPLKNSTLTKIGNPSPDWLMGISNEFNYKGVSFSFLIDIRHGGDIWNGTWQNLNNRGRSEESGDREQNKVIEGVYAPGTPNAGQKNTTEITSYSYFTNYLGNNGAQENAIQDASWVRLRAVSLGYRFNFAKNNRKVIVQSIDVGVTGRNLLLSTKYKGVDPETSLTGAGSNLNGFDYYNNPGTKSVLFNLRFTF